MRGRVLEHIFHAIDENILDIKELRPEFSKEQVSFDIDLDILHSTDILRGPPP